MLNAFKCFSGSEKVVQDDSSIWNGTFVAQWFWVFDVAVCGCEKEKSLKLFHYETLSKVSRKISDLIYINISLIEIPWKMEQTFSESKAFEICFNSSECSEAKELCLPLSESSL